MRYASILCFLFFMFQNALAFGMLTKKIETSLQEQNLNKNFVNLSLLFEDSSIGDEVNKIKLKKTIANDLLQNFHIIDPVITQRIAKNSYLRKTSFTDKNTSQEFFKKTNSEILVYTELFERSDRLFASHTIFQRDGLVVGELHQSFAKEIFLKLNIPQKKALEKNSLLVAAKDNFWSQSNLDDFFPISEQKAQDDIFSQLINYSTNKNDNSWVIYQPTAYFPTKRHTVNASFVIEDIEFVKLQSDSFRYSLGFSAFELSLNFMAYKGSLDHGHIRIKTALYNDNDQAIFALSGGLRARVYRQNQEEQIQIDQRREQLSFFLVSSGYINSFNFFYNFYFDNYSTGLGGKFFLPHQIILLVDSRLDYQSEIQERYYTLGIEHFPSTNFGYNFSLSFDDLQRDEQREKIVGQTKLGIRVTF